MTTATPAETHSQGSFEHLVLPQLPMLRSFVRLRVQNWHDAEDAVQQTLLLAFRHLGQFRFEASIGTWLCRIAINVIRARLRNPETWRAIVADPRTMESLGLQDQRPSALAVIERKEMSNRLRGAISALPETYRVVVELRDLNGLTIQETADSLFLSRPAVKSRHHRGRSMLSGLMKETGNKHRPQCPQLNHRENPVS
jgi:RNA polymerase sigma-70 factor (ECF subfamily)